MKKLFSKKNNELRKANKSGNSKEAVEKAEQGFKALAFLSWLDKHLQLRDTKSSFLKLPVETNRTSFQRSAPSDHSTDGYNSSENEEGDGDKKCSEVDENQENSPVLSSFSTETTWAKREKVKDKWWWNFGNHERNSRKIQLSLKSSNRPRRSRYESRRYEIL